MRLTIKPQAGNSVEIETESGLKFVLMDVGGKKASISAVETMQNVFVETYGISGIRKRMGQAITIKIGCEEVKK